MKLFNTLTRKKEEFKPLEGNTVRMYSCGPTVYSYAHIGNLRAYLFMDLLRRTLKYNGYDLKHVMNITDVGHLTSDADDKNYFDVESFVSHKLKIKSTDTVEVYDCDENKKSIEPMFSEI